MKIDPFVFEDEISGRRLVFISGSPDQCAGDEGRCRRQPVAIVRLIDPLPDPHYCRRHVEGHLFLGRRQVEWLPRRDRCASQDSTPARPAPSC